MTAYYGVWSGKEWWNVGNGLFHTTVKGLALAQALVVNAMRASSRRDEHWEARAIGEDGLPVLHYVPDEANDEMARVLGLRHPLSEEQKQIRAEAASHRCAYCGGVATNWVELCGCKAYLCDQHEEWRTFFRAGRLFCVPKEESCSS